MVRERRWAEGRLGRTVSRGQRTSRGGRGERMVLEPGPDLFYRVELEASGQALP